jgi:diadenylate cyclase
LHDGAVILQKDRIAAAACFLPLSMNPLLSTQMGTRHRAGIGITEETDAVSVIVSEETGAISIAVGGQVERDITPDRLRERLGELLTRYSGQSSRITHTGASHFAAAEAGNQGGDEHSVRSPERRAVERGDQS